MLKRLLIIVVFSSHLVACGDANTTRVICKNNAELCADLNEDKWCQKEKELIIRDRYAVKTDPRGVNKYHLLKSLSKFQECIKVAALIEPRTHIEIKNQRVNALLSTYDELTKLESETQNSNSPYLLYYHWQYRNDTAAKQRFLAESKRHPFKTAELQLALANVYEGNNKDKVISSLLTAVSLVRDKDLDDDGNPLLSSLLYSLITTYMQDRDYKQAYLWSKIAVNLEAEHINLSLFKSNAKLSPSQRSTLDKLAFFIAQKISQQQFVEASYYQYLASTSV